MATKIDDRQIVNRAPLSALGNTANLTLDVIMSDINTFFANASFLPTASVLMLRDANANTQANSFISSLQTTVTSDGTSTLTVASPETQVFTGTNTQACVLPAANTLTLGQKYYISNESTGTLQVNANGGSSLQLMAAGTHLIVTVTNIGSGPGTWDIFYSLGASSSATPTGVLLPFGGTTAPSGFLLCDGSAVSRFTFSNLFSIIGTSFGSGDGSTTFNVPDTRYVFLRGHGPNTIAVGPGVAAAAAHFTGTVAGLSTSVTITASNVGTIGNSISLVGNGTNTVSTLITNWNTANPSNQCTLTSGTGTQIPSNGATINLSGGVTASTSANVAAHFTGTVPGLSTSVTVTAVTAGANGNNIILMGNSSSTVSALITAWNTANPTNTATLTSGTGTQIPNNGANIVLAGGSNSTATFTAHGFNHTGLKVRLTAGTLTGLAVSTDYWIIVVDANTLSFSTTLANALNNIAIGVSGTNSGTITQFMDPDASTRAANVIGGATGANVGSWQEDGIQLHRHNMSANTGGSTYGNPNGYGDSLNGAGVGLPSNEVGSVVRSAFETRAKN